VNVEERASESEAGSEGVLDSDLEAEEAEQETDDVHDAETEEEREEEPAQPGPSTKSKLGRGKKQGKKPNTDKSAFGADEMGSLNQMSEDIDEVVKFLSETAKLILPLLEGEEKKKEKKKALKRIHDIGVQMIEAQEKLKIVPDTVMSVYNNLDLEELVEKEEDPDQIIALLEEFGEASTKELEKRSKKIGMKQVYRNETYQSFLEVLDKFYDRAGKVDDQNEPKDDGELKDGEEVGPADFTACSEDVEMLNDYIPTTDPFTRITFKDPYENRICKHVYEYQSVMDMIITSGGKTRCPYPGCSNKRYIQPDDLQKNVVVAAKIAARIQEEKQGMIYDMTVD